MKNIEYIRAEEKRYHDTFYKEANLYEAGTWLAKPVQSVLQLLPYFEQRASVKMLDLGCGVGRNSIAMAKAIQKKHGKVVCVDLLRTAIEKLKENSLQYQVEDVLEFYEQDIAMFPIPKESFDLVVAVSALEHVESEYVLDSILASIEKGVKEDGYVCLVINTEMTEEAHFFEQVLPPLLEVNLTTKAMIQKLDSIFSDWKKEKVLTKKLEYPIMRGEAKVLMKTTAITYVVKKEGFSRGE
ncbi:class I SAM-dependent methyltransferase [Alkalihalobacillus sp. 1P02AB]|uniref:class I SAM-dependent methyltransferase n=1 Tax=Alkalihalobacillus sp. 1P02AB TaxID=3132260 RepID=UPI0039A44F85